MKTTYRIILAGTMIGLLSACVGPTQLQGQWKNAQCIECFPAKSVLVVVATPNLVARRLLEDALANQLRQHNVQAVVSYMFMPTPTGNTQKNQSPEVLALANKLSLNNILTTQVIKVTEPKVYTTPGPMWGWNAFPSPYQGFNGYYNGLWNPAFDLPTTVYVSAEVYAQTTLYNVPLKQFSWMGSTQTTPMGYSMTDLAQQMAGLLVGSMATQKVIAPLQADSLAVSAP